MGKTAKIWLDVSLRNLVIMMAAATGMGVEVSHLLSLIPSAARHEIERASYFTWGELLARHAKDQERFKLRRALAGYLTHLEKAMCTAMVSLADYNHIQDAFAARLGHPWRLREAGQYAISKSFGLEAGEKLLLRAFLRWFTDPFVAISQASNANGTFNHNKTAESRRAGLGRAYIFYRYRTGPEGLPARSALEDRRSLLYWIRGIFEKLAPIWPSSKNGIGRLLRLFYPVQREVGEVHYRVIAMNLQDLIRAEAPALLHRIDGDKLIVLDANGQQEVYGRMVVLEKEAHGEFEGRYLGAHHVESSVADRGLRGIKLGRDLLVRGSDGAMLPIALKGEIYAPGVTETVIELRWVTHPLWSPLFRFLSAGPIAMQGFKLGIEAEMRTTVAAAAAQTTTRQMEALQDQVFEAYPTRALGEAIANGTFPSHGIDNTCAVVVCDVIGFTKHQIEAEQGGQKAVFAKRITDALEACHSDTILNGGWNKPTKGDQIFAFFPLSWDGYGKSDAEEHGYGLGDLCRRALESAHNFRANFETRGFHVRVAVHMGELMWEVVAGVFDATGPAISVAAHIESVALKAILQELPAQQSLLAVTQEVVREVQRTTQWQIEGLLEPAEVELKRGEKVIIHLVE